MRTRIDGLVDDKQIIQLWQNYAEPDSKQVGSNRNEHCHSYKKELAPALHNFGHKFWASFRVIHIWSYNHKSLQFIDDNPHLFNIKVPGYTDNLTRLFDKVHSLQGIGGTGDFFTPIIFDEEWIQNRDIYSVEQCREKKILRYKGAHLKWGVTDDSMLLKWIKDNDYYEKDVFLSQNIFDDCCQHRDFVSYAPHLLLQKLKPYFTGSYVSGFEEPQMDEFTMDEKEEGSDAEVGSYEDPESFHLLNLHLTPSCKRKDMIVMLQKFAVQKKLDLVKLFEIYKQKICPTCNKSKWEFLFVKDLIHFVQNTICCICSGTFPDAKCSKCRRLVHSAETKMNSDNEILCWQC